MPLNAAPMGDIQLAIERFVRDSKQPVLSEPGEELIPITDGHLALDLRPGVLILHAWDDRHSLVRRVTAVESETRSRLTLRIDRFGKKIGTIALLDLQRLDSQRITRRSANLEVRELFRRFLRREFADFKIAELSTELNLEQSLSPVYPRALLVRGSSALAAIAAPVDSVDGALSFGLIWLDYLRRRERGPLVAGLVLLLPEGHENATCLRLRFLDRAKAQYRVFVYGEEGHARQLDPSDTGNLSTELTPCRRADPPIAGVTDLLMAVAGVESVDLDDGSTSFRVQGLEFARILNGQVVWGIETKRRLGSSTIREVEALARELSRVRSAGAPDRHHPLYLRNREAWLESAVRAQIEELDPLLSRTPLYGQVPAFTGGERGVLDLLAVGRNGRLAVIELKAAQDIHLPLQALDYWMRVQWHAARGDFSKNGYFPGIELRSDAPRLLLVAPALDFHPSNERVLRFFSPAVQVTRLGVGIEWQKRVKLMYRM